MSATWGAVSHIGYMLLNWNDERNRLPMDSWNNWNRNQQSPWADALLWPTSTLMSGDGSTGYLYGSEPLQRAKWENICTWQDESGGQGRLKIRGFTKDSAGNALSSCTVQGFITSTDAYVSDCISDQGGYYEFCTQFPSTNHYLVAYKGGSPDVAGTTVNTLQPS